MIRRKSKSCKLFSFIFIKISVCTFIVHQFPSIISHKEDIWKRFHDFVDVLSKRASADKFIILAMADYPFRDMAMNLYETSFKKHNIENFLFIANGRRLCDYMDERLLPCFVYTSNDDSDVSSKYGTLGFKQKMNIRTDMILDALRAGFTVLHTDVDVVFLKNPLPDLKQAMEAFDMGIMWDHVNFNAGFLVIKPTNFSIDIYEQVKIITRISPDIDDQLALNSALNVTRQRQAAFPVTVLDQNKYMCGFVYSEDGNRYFPSDCPDCLVVHNNWIVSHEAKIYRFKEHLTWMYEEDSYYSSTSRKYLVYKNPITWSSSDATIEEELGALKAALALGKMLNRTVILPRFHKQNKEIPLNGLLSIADFDKVFHNRYRENSFLHHPWVPTSLKSGQDKTLHSIFAGSPKTIDIETFVENTVSIGKGMVIWNTSTKNGDIPEKDILQHCHENEDRILEFASLYGLHPMFSRYEEQSRFEEDTEKAFVRRGYRQQIWHA